MSRIIPIRIIKLILILINWLIVMPQDIYQEKSTLDIGNAKWDCWKYKDIVKRLNYLENVLNGLKSECKEEYYAFSQSILEESYSWNKNEFCTKKSFDSHVKRLQYLEDLKSRIEEHCRKHTSHTQSSTYPKTTTALTESTTSGYTSRNSTSSTMTTQDTTDPFMARDCLEIFNSNISFVNGIHRISPDNRTEFDVYCDMTDGGWTVIQMRLNDTVNFTRDWNDYVAGFGDLKQGNFWLGLDYIHILTTPPVDVMIEGITWDTGERVWMWYSDFSVNGPKTNYMMEINLVGKYNDVAIRLNYDNDNGFGYHNRMPFATYDNPDRNNCVNLWGNGGGWWYRACWQVLVNNLYANMNLRGGTASGPVISSKIKVRRNLD